MAVTARAGQGRTTRGVVSQRPRLGAETFEAACTRLGVVQSMGKAGSALDNAAAQAVKSTIKVERVHRHRFATRAAARAEIGAWISGFDNTRRRHSACGGLSPVDYEQLISTDLTVDLKTGPHRDRLHDHRGLTGCCVSRQRIHGHAAGLVNSRWARYVRNDAVTIGHAPAGRGRDGSVVG